MNRILAYLRKEFLIQVSYRFAYMLTLLGVFSACGSPEEPATPRLNVVFFLVDDLGWTDVGAFGSTFPMLLAYGKD